MQPQNSQDNIVDFSEIQPLLGRFPTADLEVVTHAENWLAAQKAAGQDLQKMGELGVWLAGWQGRFPPRLVRPNLSIFAVPVDGSNPQDLLADSRMQNILQMLDADVRLYEMAPPEVMPATLTQEDCARAMAYGMMAVGEGVDIVALAAAPHAAATACAQDLITSLQDQTPKPSEVFALLQRPDAQEIAGLSGAIIAARLASRPVILEGLTGLAAAMVVAKATGNRPQSVAHCLLLPATLPSEAKTAVESLECGHLPTLPCGPLTGLPSAQALLTLRQAALVVGGEG